MDQQISRILAAGIGEGRGPYDIARQLNERVDKIGVTRSRMLARTEVINAHADASLNAYEEAGLEGVDVEAEWLTAADACPECEEASNGGPYTISEARGLIPFHPNCLPANSLVLSRSGVLAVSKRWFDGDMIVINTSSGRMIECTPNHPVLSGDGWVPAELFNVGDKIVCDAGSEWVAFGDGDNENIPTAIHDVFESFVGSGDVTTMPVPLSAEDFHGDAADGEVAIIGSNVSLDDVVNSTSIKPLCKKALNVAIKRCILEFCGSSKRELFDTSLSSSGSVMGSFDISELLLFGPIAHNNSVSLSNPPNNESSIGKSGVYGASRDAELARNLINGLASDVFLDDVVSVERYNFRGHVYNLDSGEGWYSANGIVTHNCRCAWSPKVVSGTGIELI